MKPIVLDAQVGLAQVEAKASSPQQALALACSILRDPASGRDARQVAARLCAMLAGQPDQPT